MRPNAPLFEVLADNPPTWWINLLNDKDLAIQIRKDNTIDVYFNGGALITGLQYDSRSKVFSASIHHKYLPLEVNDTYISINSKEGSFDIAEPISTISSLNNFNPSTIKRIKNLISNRYPTGSEKWIQYSFFRNDPCFIDTEYQWDSEGKANRIDLVRIDLRSNLIVFVEVKTIGDNRLYTDKINSQMDSYKNYLQKRSEHIKKHFQLVFEIKKKIGALPNDLKQLANLNNFGVCPKPLLLIGDCNQDWINNNSHKIDDNIKSSAIGTYYFGSPKYSCELIEKTIKNRHIYT